jgi:2-iminobutanoate/2-iminopropanoate deaminase
MAEIRTVFHPEATPPRGPYAQAIRVANARETLYTGTITALDSEWNIVGSGDIEAQTRKTIENLELILEAADMSIENVVQTTWYLVRIEDMPAVARVRNEMFRGHAPASGTIPINALYYPELLLEMQAIAAR